MFKKNKLRIALSLAIASIAFVPMNVALADDVEIYKGGSMTGSAGKSNLLFLLDTSGSMAWGTRSSDMITGFKALVDSLSDDERVGLGRYSSRAGSIALPVEALGKIVSYLKLEKKVTAAYDGEETAGSMDTNNQSTVLTTDGDNYAGFIFKDLELPSHSFIESSYFTLVPKATIAGSAQFEISLVDKSSVDNLNAVKLKDRTTISSKVFTVNWAKDIPVNFDLTDQIDALSKKAYWCGGDVGIIIRNVTSGDSDVSFYMSEYTTNAYFAPKLSVEYNPTGSSCISQGSTLQISTSKGDGDQSSGGTMDLDYATIWGTSGYPNMGLVFNGLPVEKNASVLDARLELVTANLGHNDNSNPKMRIRAFDYNNMSLLKTSKKYITKRNVTSAYVDFSWSNGRNKTITSPNLKTLIEEVTSRSGWNENNRIGFRLERLNAEYSFHAYDGDSSKAAKLTIDSGITVAPVAAVTHREMLKTTISSFPFKNGTPITASYLEAASYFQGKRVNFAHEKYARRDDISGSATYRFGTESIPGNCDLVNDPYDSDCENSEILDNPVYNSPIQGGGCEANAIIMLTDGDPSQYLTYDNYNNRNVKEQIADMGLGACSDSWDCSRKLAFALNTKDQRTDIPGVQTIQTYTVGLELGNEDGMKSVARQGGGKYFSASNATDLQTAFQDIVDNVRVKGASIVLPGISINQTNRYQHKDELYYSVFNPNNGNSWEGNVKRFRMDSSGTITPGSQFVIVDSNNNPAIDPTTKYFSETSVSHWNTYVDGGAVDKGGVVSKFTVPRNVYTYTGTGQPKNVVLNNNHRVRNSNNKLKKSMFGLANSYPNADWTKLKNWASGEGITDSNSDGIMDPRYSMGDPLHSRPLMINYGGTSDTIFVSTNHGYLHAFDSVTGRELMSFVAPEFLPNLLEHYNNSSSTQLYGFDSPWIAYRKDVDNDGLIESSDGDYVMLYGGMRRGGSGYYALDISKVRSDVANPTLEIKFTLNKDSDAKFANMGQTWSVPRMAKIKIGSTDRVVLIFGGGYDVIHDDATVVSNEDTKGNQIYIVDALTGDVIWWAGKGEGNLQLSTMTHAIPGSVELFDLNKDGYIDNIYAADLGGQIFRFDINNGESLSNLITGKRIANLGAKYGAGGISNNRRFFEGPIAAPALDESGIKYIAVSLGSGYRAHPLEASTQDTLYIIKDLEAANPGVTGYEITSPYTRSDLLDVTTNVDKTDIKANLSGKHGLLIDLGVPNSSIAGEKVMGEVTIFNNQILFTTYIPTTSSGICSSVLGHSRLYMIDLLTGAPVSDLDESGDENNLTPRDRYIDNLVPGLSSGTRIMYTENGAVAITNTDLKGISTTDEMGSFKTTWRPITKDSANVIRDAAGVARP